MQYELNDYKWRVVGPMLPNKPRGVPRVDDRRVLNGIFDADWIRQFVSDQGDAEVGVKWTLDSCD
jgi:transposase